VPSIYVPCHKIIEFSKKKCFVQIGKHSKGVAAIPMFVFVCFLKGENKGLAWQQKQLVHVASRLRAIRISQKSVCIKHVAIETDTLPASGLPQHHYHLI
jgi:hypothetical protein